MEQKEMLLASGLSVFVLPVDVRFIGDAETFNTKIIDFINQYPPTTTLHENA